MPSRASFFLVLLCDSPENVLQRTYEAAEKVENKSNTLHHNVTRENHGYVLLCKIDLWL